MNKKTFQLLKCIDELNQAIVAHIQPGAMATDKRLCKAHLKALKLMGEAQKSGWNKYGGSNE